MNLKEHFNNQGLYNSILSIFLPIIIYILIIPYLWNNIIYNISPDLFLKVNTVTVICIVALFIINFLLTNSIIDYIRNEN